jgi:hypothetical protein
LANRTLTAGREFETRTNQKCVEQRRVSEKIPTKKLFLSNEKLREKEMWGI